MTSISHKIRSRALGIAACAALGALCVYVFVHDPAVSPVSFCMVRALTGRYCPGCGGTRALHALFHLDIRAALGYNLFLTPLLPVVAYIVLAELVHMIAGRYVLRQIPLNPWVVACIGALFLLFGVLRNLPALAFLAPV